MISHRHEWATALMAFMAISLVMAFNTASAQATDTESVVSNWSNPGSFPFTGDYSDVCKLYEKEISGEQCVRALDQEERGLGDEFFLQDDYILQVSFTVGGQHQSKILKVDFGTDVPEDDPMRRAVVYDTGRLDGLKLVRPDVCGNWSLMTIRDSVPTETAVAATQTTEVFACSMQPRQRLMGGEALFLPGQQTCGGGCDQSFHIPGLFLEGSMIQSNGQGLVCGWYPVQ